MDIELISNSLLGAPILFFLFGFVAVVLKTELELPQALPKLLSTYLVVAIGLKGGMELNGHGLSQDSWIVLGLAFVFSVIVPLYTYLLLRKKTSPENAAAISATYGSVSAVTFITAVSALEGLNISYHGHMVAAMALMEAPAIVIGVILARYFSGDSATEDNGQPRQSLLSLVASALKHGPIVILLGSLVIGRLASPKSATLIKPFFEGMFPGVLCLYLFEMGLSAAKRLVALNVFDRFLCGFAVGVPVVNATLAILAAFTCGLTQGDAFLLCVLCASASYIAVPAAMQLAVPKADPGLYMTMALAITFPFNVAVGIPLYLTIIRSVIA
jgi:hypothetical protein